MPGYVDARNLTTKRAAAAELGRHGSGYVLAGATLAGLLLRGRSRRPVGRADLAAAGAVLALQPLVEWWLHRSLLHGRPRTVLGRTVDLAAPHLGHHRYPDDVRTILLGAGFALPNAVVAGAAATAVGLLAGGPGAVGTAVATGEAGLAAYEWAHLLSHSGYRPRTARFRRLRAAHLRHHHRDDSTNFGITSRLGDRLFGTAT